MKQLLRIQLVMLLVFLCGTSPALADAYKTLTFSKDIDQTGVDVYTKSWDAVVGSDRWTITNFTNNQKGWDYIRCGTKAAASVATIKNTTLFDKGIAKVVVTIDQNANFDASLINGIYLTVTSSVTGATIATVDASDIAIGEITFDLSQTETSKDYYYTIAFDCKQRTDKKNGTIQVSKVEYYDDGKAATTTTFPAVDGNATYTTTEARADGFQLPVAQVVSDGVTIDDAAIQYTSSNEGVVRYASDGSYEILTAGTTQITATYHGDDTHSGSATTYTLQLRDVCNGIPAIQQLLDVATSESIIADVTLENVYVTAVDGSQAYLCDGEYGILLYSPKHWLVKGDLINGTIKDATLSLFKGSYQLQGFKRDNLTITNETITPTEATISALTKKNVGRYVTLKNLTYVQRKGVTPGVFRDDNGYEIAFYDGLGTKPTLVDGNLYDVTAIVGYYNELQLMPTEVTALTTPATITADTTLTTVLTKGAEDSFTVTYTGDGSVYAESSDDNVATAEAAADGKTITVKALCPGEATIKVSASAGQTYGTPDPITYTLYVTDTDENLVVIRCTDSDVVGRGSIGQSFGDPWTVTRDDVAVQFSDAYGYKNEDKEPTSLRVHIKSKMTIAAKKGYVVSQVKLNILHATNHIGTWTDDLGNAIAMVDSAITWVGVRDTLVLNNIDASMATYIDNIIITYLPADKVSEQATTTTFDLITAPSVTISLEDKPVLKASVKVGERTINTAKVTYTSTNAAVATIDTDGTLTPVSGGQTSIIASYAGDTYYKASADTLGILVKGFCQTIPEVQTAIDHITGDETVADIVFKDIIVTDTCAGKAYISDGVYGLQILTDEPCFKPGDVLNGTATGVILSAIDGAYTIKGLLKDELTITTGELTPTTVTLYELDKHMIGRYVVMEKIEYNSQGDVLQTEKEQSFLYDRSHAYIKISSFVPYQMTGVVTYTNRIALMPSKVMRYGYLRDKSKHRSLLYTARQDTYQIYYEGDGTVTATSTDTDVATAQYDAKTETVTINALTPGTTTITIASSDEQTYLPITGITYELTVKDASLIPNRAYVDLDWTNYTLIFHYDIYRDSVQSLHRYDLPADGETSAWDKYKTYIHKVVFDSTFQDARLKYCNTWFTCQENLETIEGIEYLNTSNMKDLSGLFYGCTALKEVDLSHLVTDSVTNMNRMFSGCKALEQLDLTAFKTTNVTSMQQMFYGCENLNAIDLSSINTAKVTDMSNMFYGCKNLKSLNLNSFNTAKVTNMVQMFDGCSTLKDIYVNGDSLSLASIEYDYNMFNACDSLPGFDKNTVDRAKAKDLSEGGYLKVCALQPWAEYQAEAQTLTFHYDYDKYFATADATYNLNTGDNEPDWFANREKIKEVIFDDSFAKAQPTTCYRWFMGMKNLTTLTGLSNLNTTEVTNMQQMFDGCEALTALDLSTFNTAKVTTMNSMFNSAKSLKKLTLSDQFTGTSLEDARWCFMDCESLTKLDLSQFVTTKALTQTAQMFRLCTSLKELNLSGLVTSGVTDMGSMFLNSSALERIFVSDDFTVSSTCDGDEMFYGCTSLPGFNAKRIGKAMACYYPSGYFFSNATAMWTSYDADTETMTFHYNAKKEADKTSTYTYDVPTSTPWPGDWITDLVEKKITIKKVIFDDDFAFARPTQCCYWFIHMADLTEIEGMKNLNISETELMDLMFYGCSSLTTLDLTTWNPSAIHSAREMFEGCASLENIYVTEDFVLPEDCEAKDMFKNSDRLPHYKDSEYDGTYAHYKEGGYLTLRRQFAVGDTQYNVDGYGDEATCYDDVTFTDGAAFSASFPFSFSSDNTASYSRTMKNHWATLCLPFSFNTETNSSAKYYTVTTYDNANLTVCTLKGDIPAGLPVLAYVAEPSTISITATAAAVVANPAKDDVLQGAFAKTEVSSADYIIANDHFWNAGWLMTEQKANGVYVAPYRAYLTLTVLTSSAKPNSISISDGETNGIDSIDSAADLADLLNGATLYDLQGRRLSSPIRGVMIIHKDGVSHKVVIK